MFNVNIELLRKLVEIPAPSGHEDRMIEFLRNYMARYADSVEVDKIGNVIGIVKGESKEAPRVMVSAHMDEIGLVIRRIDDDGFLRFERLGGVEPKTLFSREVQVITEEKLIDGVIGVRAHHLAAYQKEIEPIKDMYIDIGVRNKEEALKLGVRVGDPVVFKPNFKILNNAYVSSKAMDNRSNLLVLLELLKVFSDERPKATVYFTGTVLEEFNVRGSLPAAFKISPDVVFCLEIGVATDTPDLRGLGSDVRLGRGPVISLYSFHGRGTLGGLIPHPQLVKFVENIARREGIPYQRSIFFGGLSEASFLPVLREGIPAIDIGVPCRYTHSPNEMVAISDIEATINLMTRVLRNIDEKFKLKRG